MNGLDWRAYCSGADNEGDKMRTSSYLRQCFATRDCFHSLCSMHRRLLTGVGAVIVTSVLSGCQATPTEEAVKICENKPLISEQQGVSATIQTSKDNLKMGLSLNVNAYERFLSQLEGYNASYEQVFQVTKTVCSRYYACQIGAERDHVNMSKCNVYWSEYRDIESNLLGFILQVQGVAKKVEQVAEEGGTQPKPTPAILDEPGTVIGWSNVTTQGPKFQVAAAPYLNDYGVSIGELKPAESRVVLVDNLGLYEGKSVRPQYSQVFLTQTDVGNGPASFSLVFKVPVRSVAITRPTLYADTASGVTHPAWSARAFDETGHELAAFSEGLTRSFTTVPAQTYSLVAPGFNGIKSVRLDSDFRLNGVPFAGFGAVLIERIVTTPLNQK